MGIHIEVGGEAETELMPKRVVGYTEPGGSKLKKGKGFLEPNFGEGPNWLGEFVPDLRISRAQDTEPHTCGMRKS